MRNKSNNIRAGFISILINPWVLAIPIALLVIAVLPDMQEPYKLELVLKQKGDKTPQAEEFFTDLNNDGNTERIVSFYNVSGNAALKVWTTDHRLIDQYNWHGVFLNNYKFVQVFDTDHDGKMEVIFGLLRHDSVFIVQFNPLLKTALNHEYFVENLPDSTNPNQSPFIYVSSTMDIDSDGVNELFIELAAHLEKSPRKAIVLNTKTGDILKSDDLGAKITGLFPDPRYKAGDGYLVQTRASANLKPSEVSFLHDHSSWLLGFDANMKLRDTLLEYPYLFSTIKSLFFRKQNKIVGLAHNQSQEEVLDKIFMVDSSGFFVRDFPPSAHYFKDIGIVPFFEDSSQKYLYYNEQGNIFILKDTEIISNIDKHQDASTQFIGREPCEISGDGKNEFIAMDLLSDELIILSHDLKHKSILSAINISEEHFFSPSVRRKQGEKPQLFFKLHGNNYYYTYQANPLYYLHYPVYLLIYLLITVLIYLMWSYQKAQLQKKYELERAFESLQLKTLKNQLEPHFIFNALNAINATIAQGQYESAQYYLLRFSRLMQKLLFKSDQLTVSLEDELEFVENYLEIERLRFGEELYFEIHKSENVPPQIRIPKMLVQSFVENAIKHGLKPLNHKGRILIDVHMGGKHVHINISDNGIGREAAAQKNTNSGKGLSIVQKMLLLYERQQKKQIKYYYTDLFDDEGRAAGTKVSVQLPVI